MIFILHFNDIEINLLRFQKHFNGSFVLLEVINNKIPENKK
jgi:hypothetical protein